MNARETLETLVPALARRARQVVDVRMPATEGAGAAVRALLADPAGSALPPERLEDARVAVTEAVENVARHAYPVRSGPVRATVWTAAGSLLVLIADEGRGLARRLPQTAGAGLGLRLIAALASELRLHSRAGETLVLMVFHPWPPGEPSPA